MERLNINNTDFKARLDRQWMKKTARERVRRREWLLVPWRGGRLVHTHIGRESSSNMLMLLLVARGRWGNS